MSESQRTLIFVGVALVSGVLAWFAGPSAPKPNTEIVGVGELFYPDFKDADAAKSMEVVNYNPDTASVRPFAIVQDKSGLWRIPYAHNYPADGKERLAKTATAMTRKHTLRGEGSSSKLLRMASAAASPISNVSPISRRPTRCHFRQSGSRGAAPARTKSDFRRCKDVATVPRRHRRVLTV